MSTERLTCKAGEIVDLPKRGALPLTKHVFDDDSILAVNAALAIGRPLLVRGEPGTGKSQLARAVAHALGRVYLTKVIDGRTDTSDLFYSFDAVGRLAEAQLCGALAHIDEVTRRERLAVRRFVTPGPLWWAFDWVSATRQAGLVNGFAPETPAEFEPGRGAVVLLDEIDKADTSVPNGLLEALGNGEFPVPTGEVIASTGRAPLVIVTTNEERALPDAFLRRCMVLHLRLPETKDGLVTWLVDRGGAHFEHLSVEVRTRAAELLWEDRGGLVSRGLAPPGQAEYLDLLKAVTELKADGAAQLALLERVAGFALRKHPEDRGV